MAREQTNNQALSSFWARVSSSQVEVKASTTLLNKSLATIAQSLKIAGLDQSGKVVILPGSGESPILVSYGEVELPNPQRVSPSALAPQMIRNQMSGPGKHVSMQDGLWQPFQMLCNITSNLYQVADSDEAGYQLRLDAIVGTALSQAAVARAAAKSGAISYWDYLRSNQRPKWSISDQFEVRVGQLQVAYRDGLPMHPEDSDDARFLIEQIKKRFDGGVKSIIESSLRKHVGNAWPAPVQFLQYRAACAAMRYLNTFHDEARASLPDGQKPYFDLAVAVARRQASAYAESAIESAGNIRTTTHPSHFGAPRYNQESWPSYVQKVSATCSESFDIDAMIVPSCVAGDHCEILRDYAIAMKVGKLTLRDGTSPRYAESMIGMRFSRGPISFEQDAKQSILLPMRGVMIEYVPMVVLDIEKPPKSEQRGDQKQDPEGDEHGDEKSPASGPTGDEQDDEQEDQADGDSDNSDGDSEGKSDDGDSGDTDGDGDDSDGDGDSDNTDGDDADDGDGDDSDGDGDSDNTDGDDADDGDGDDADADDQPSGAGGYSAEDIEALATSSSHTRDLATSKINAISQIDCEAVGDSIISPKGELVQIPCAASYVGQAAQKISPGREFMKPPSQDPEYGKVKAALESLLDRYRSDDNTLTNRYQQQGKIDQTRLHRSPVSADIFKDSEIGVEERSRINLVIDASGSMTSGHANEAVGRVVAALAEISAEWGTFDVSATYIGVDRPGMVDSPSRSWNEKSDKLGLRRFDSKAMWTEDVDEIRMMAGAAIGGTPTPDAIATLIGALRHTSVPGRREAVIIMTDGESNDASLTCEATKRLIKEGRCPVGAIGFRVSKHTLTKHFGENTLRFAETYDDISALTRGFAGMINRMLG